MRKIINSQGYTLKELSNQVSKKMTMKTHISKKTYNRKITKFRWKNAV